MRRAVERIREGSRNVLEGAKAARATLVLCAMLGVVVIAGGLAIEAHDAGLSQRRTAEMALQDYARFAARAYAARADESLRRAAMEKLGAVVGSRAASPYERLPDPSVVTRTYAPALDCATGATPAGHWSFRVDFRDGSFAADASVDRATAERITTLVTEATRSRVLASAGVGVLVEPASVGDVLVYGIKAAQHGAPIAAYGFSTCRATLERLLADAAREPLLPPASHSRGSERSLVSVVVGAPGDTLFATAAQYRSPYVADAPLQTSTDLAASVTLHPAAVERVVIGALPQARLVRLAILVTCAALLLVAMAVLIRRERELLRMRSDFTASVSHELRMPLAQILLYAETLQLGRIRSGEEGREAVSVIVHEARRLLRLVENVLHVARTEHGVIALRLEPTDVSQLLADCVLAAAPLAAQSGSELHLQAPEAQWARVDRGALRQMVLNGVDNALNYGRPGQIVRVTLESRGDRLAIHIDDQGGGVRPADRERVFERFVRLDHSSSVTGSGIGLAVVRELALLHEGRVYLGDAPSGGARLAIELPTRCLPDEEALVAREKTRGVPAGVAS
jgi:signal transduction histidine kinase